MIIGIIGGGASGMVAALSAAENPNVQVILMERQGRVGRKLMATGNGRCNLTNIHANGNSYHGQQPSFSYDALDAFGPDKTISWFQDMGLYTVTEETGRVYPYSDQANSVVDILRLNLVKSNITVQTDFEVNKIRVLDTGFSVFSSDECLFCDKLIIACGGLAGTKLGGTMSGYKLLGKLGHKSSRLRPALVQLKSNWKMLSGLKGVRTQCHACIFHDGTLFSQSKGELQFTDFGLSGPVIFEISRDVCSVAGDWYCKLDFLPDLTHKEISALIEQRMLKNLAVQDLFTGILHNRLGRILTQCAGVNLNMPCSELTQEDIFALVCAVKEFEVTLTEPMGMDHAQVTAGGVLTEQFDSKTMESRLIPGLYACGEVLDIDGDCGGFNLQWAWSSGRLAGLSAGEVAG